MSEADVPLPPKGLRKARPTERRPLWVVISWHCRPLPSHPLYPGGFNRSGQHLL